MKRMISRLAIAIGIIVAANAAIGFFFDAQKETSGHRYLNRYKAALLKGEPDVVLVGNSMLDEGVDSKRLSSLLGVKCIKIAKGGSASAAWYLILKNAIVPARKKPRFVVLFFRDVFLTYPSYRVTGTYRDYIADVSSEYEPLLDQLAYGQDPAEQFIAKVLPAYVQRKQATGKLDRAIKNNLVGAMANLSESDVNSNISKLFDDKNMAEEIVTKQQIAAESVTENDLYDFKAALEKSFLPHIVSIAENAGIRIAAVRVKRRRDLEPGLEPAELVGYISELADYFALHDIPFIDFTHRPEIREEHYGKGDHLARPKGQKLFTELLAKELEPLIVPVVTNP